MSTQPESSWHIEKGVPLALIVTIAVQTASMIWWAAGINGRVDNLEKQVAAASWQSERIIRIDERLNSVQSNVSDIKNLLQTSKRRF